MKKLFAALVSLALLAGCAAPAPQPETALDLMELHTLPQTEAPVEGGRSFYEVFVYSFCDSNGDGIGDLKGLQSKLDYIQDMGFNGLWLMPIMPSTTYHKYDVTDYCAIDPQYGTMEDFDALLAECHDRGIAVILDLVLNHTSSEHPWFRTAEAYLQSLPAGAATDPVACPEAAYYNFSAEKKGGWYQVEGCEWYYEAPFWSEMPDLDLRADSVRQEIADITAFWLDKGVDGFRLDAAKEYISGSTNGNIEFLTWFRELCASITDRPLTLVAEVWTDMNSYAPYYDSGISCFNFAFADKSGIIANGVKKNSPEGYANGLNLVGELLAQHPGLPDAPFYTNHDLPRGAGYYAGEDALDQIKLAQALNLTMSGNAFLYYGEEIAMKGSGKDENKRAPMYWGDEAEGLCDGPEYMDAVKMMYGSLESQQADENSVWHYVRRAVQIRNAFPAIAAGRLVSASAEGTVCRVVKEYEGQTITLLYNFGAEAQTVAAEGELKATLLTRFEDAALRDGQLTLPAYAVAVLG